LEDGEGNGTMAAPLAEVAVEISGQRYVVPEAITIIQALWAAGRRTLHGVGCLGGVCGACPVSYRLPNELQAKTGLACQTLVQEGMSVLTLPSDPSKGARYVLPSHLPEKKDLFASYPETRRCTSCNACTLVCPQGIEVMGGVRAALNGDFAACAEKFTACVMCGLCAMVCDVKILPHRVGLWSRRMHGAFVPKPPQLVTRLAEIRDGRFQRDWEHVLQDSAEGANSPAM